MVLIKKTHPLTKVESKLLNSIKKEKTIKFFEKYKIKGLIDQDPGEKIPSFSNILKKTSYSVIRIPNQPWEVRFNFKKTRGVTKIFLHNKYDSGKPSLIFHHGLASSKNTELKVFLNSIFLDKFNVFSIKAANHDSLRQVIRQCVNKFMNLATTTCASVIAINEIVNFIRDNSDKPIFVVGLSMGGIVTGLHYFYFGTANFYFPIIAYPNFGEIILSEKNRPLIHNYQKLSRNASIKNCFEIPKVLKKKPKEKIYPILGSNDELIDFKDAQKFWKGYKTKTFNTGHFSIALKIGEIRNYILETSGVQ